MAHLRRRSIEGLYKKLIRFGPILGLFGHRQTGKSTWVSATAGEYFTLDDSETLERAQKHAKEFIQSRKKHPCVIDECQQAPSLFPALKERVRTDKRPGQFILTGSVRFSSRKAIRESLAGRISNLELLPLTISEISARPLPETVPELIRMKSFGPTSLASLPSANQITAARKDFTKYLSHGGLPGMCFTREGRLRREQLTDLHNLILDRDLKMIVDTRLSVGTLRSFLQILARSALEPYNASEVKRLLGLANVTQRSLLYALESIFLIRPIPILGSPKLSYLFEDQFEEYFLSQNSLPEMVQATTLLYRNIRAQFSYRVGQTATFKTYQTRSNARVPLVVDSGDGGLLGFIPTETQIPSLSQSRSADSFLRKFSDAKIVYASIETTPGRILDSRCLVCPLTALI